MSIIISVSILNKYVNKNEISILLTIDKKRSNFLLTSTFESLSIKKTTKIKKNIADFIFIFTFAPPF
jgi:hypothetical protein